MATLKVILESSTFARAIKHEIKQHLPKAEKFHKSFVPEIGKVLYIKNSSGQTLAHCYKEKHQLVLLIKGV